MNPHGDFLTDDAAFLDALEHGPPATLNLYRRAYTTAGVPWPGDDEIRRRHPITPPDTETSTERRLTGSDWVDGHAATTARWRAPAPPDPG